MYEMYPVVGLLLFEHAKKIVQYPRKKELPALFKNLGSLLTFFIMIVLEQLYKF